MLHANFKINDTSFTQQSLLKYAKKLQVSKEIYLQEIGSFIDNWFSNTTYIIVQTSGATGKPKPIKLLKTNMINSALATGDYFNLQKNTTALLCLSANYIAGKMMLVRAITLGWNLHIVAPTSKPLNNLTKMYDFCAMVPLQVAQSVLELSKIEQLIIGGATISESLLKKIQALNTKCYATYGMTETITHIAIKDLKKKDNCFKILPNVQISIDNRNCLIIDAPKVAKYKITTNDVVKLVSATEFKWLGRFDNIINSGGIKLFPEQLEKKLATIINTRFFVIGIPDDKLGEKLILLVETDKKENQLFSKIKELKILTKFEIPKKMYTISKFTETPTGKIKRKATLKKVLY